jgi:hypothetical protein
MSDHICVYATYLKKPESLYIENDEVRPTRLRMEVADEVRQILRNEARDLLCSSSLSQIIAGPEAVSQLLLLPLKVVLLLIVNGFRIAYKHQPRR